MNKITISVIIPCYNSERTIEICLKSVLDQNESVDEIVVVDDGSTDDSIRIVERIFGNLNKDIKCVLYKQNNQGPSVARNKGVELASGSYIAFIDSDDQWYPNHVFFGKSFIENNYEYKIVTTKYFSAPIKFHGEVLFKKQLLKNYMITPCVLLNRDCFWEFGGFNEKMRYAEDYYLWLKVIHKHKGYVLDYVGGSNIELKRPFGEKGLSSNLIAMHKGVLNCYESLYMEQIINLNEYILLKYFEKLKYFRRKWLTFMYGELLKN